MTHAPQRHALAVRSVRPSSAATSVSDHPWRATIWRNRYVLSCMAIFCHGKYLPSTHHRRSPRRHGCALAPKCGLAHHSRAARRHGASEHRVGIHAIKKPTGEGGSMFDSMEPVGGNRRCQASSARTRLQSGPAGRQRQLSSSRRLPSRDADIPAPL